MYLILKFGDLFQWVGGINKFQHQKDELTPKPRDQS